MASSKKKADIPELTKYQIGEEIEVCREKLKNAPYNPRTISASAKKKLRANLKKVGLLGSCVVWNRTTGNIVSGHKRVASLDALEGKSNYNLRVTVVEMDEVTEKEQNVFMNNPEAQGDFDVDSLGDLMSADMGLSVENMGFDEADKIEMFGVESLDAEEAVNLAKKLRDSRDLFDKIKGKNKKRGDDDFFCVVVFKDNAHRQELSDLLDIEDARYINGSLLLDLLKGVKVEPDA